MSFYQIQYARVERSSPQARFCDNKGLLAVDIDHLVPGAHIPPYVSRVLYMVGPPVWPRAMVIHAQDLGQLNGHQSSTREWHIALDGEDLTAARSRSRHDRDQDIIAKMTSILPFESRLPTLAEYRTAFQVERAIANGMNLVGGTPAAMAMVFARAWTSSRPT